MCKWRLAHWAAVVPDPRYVRVAAGAFRPRMRRTKVKAEAGWGAAETGQTRTEAAGEAPWRFKATS